MTTHDWNTTLDHAVHAFSGQLPGADLEQDLRAQFEHQPSVIAAMLKRVAKQHAAGTVPSPWGVIRTELRRRAAAGIKATDQADQDQALARAQQWMRAAGIHFDRWPEVEDELFGDRGKLSEWPHLKPTIEQLWTELRPLGEQVEREELERAERRRQQLAQIEAARHAKRTPDPDPETNPLLAA